MRVELKNKYDRHVKDLTEYYERELDDLKRALTAYRLKYGDLNQILTESTTDTVSSSAANILNTKSCNDLNVEMQQQKNVADSYKIRCDQITANYIELKSSYENLLNKIVSI